MSAFDHFFEAIVRRVQDLVRDEVERVIRLQPTARHSLVNAFDPKTWSAKYAIQPEGVVTGWSPMHAPWVGDGYGFFAPPAVGPDQGDQIFHAFPQFGANEGFGVTRAWDARKKIPDAVKQLQAGELMLIDKQGSMYSMTKDGSLTLQGKVKIVTSAPDYTHTAQNTWTTNTPNATFKNGGSTQPVKLADGSNSTVLFAQ
ncbi:MAG TPA: hypothetical protein VFA12_20090 [Stellaceae bacterium]|nr:hypothetical protein [Stellaceae bacterium]